MKKVLALVPLAAGLLASCTDTSYDLDSIDMTMGSEVNLTLPTLSTDEIVLRNVMDLKADDIVRVVKTPAGDDSIYVIVEAGSVDVDPISIGNISLHKPEIPEFNADVNLRALVNSTKAQGRGKRGINIQGLSISGLTYHYDVVESMATQSFKTEANGISSDIISLKSISCYETTLTTELLISGIPQWAPTIHLDNVKLNLPSELHITGCKLDGTALPADHISADGTILLTDDYSVHRTANGDFILRLALSFDKLSTGPHFEFNGDLHKAVIDGKVGVTGTFRVDIDEADEAGLNAALEDKGPINLGNLASIITNLMPEHLLLNGKTALNKDITLTHVTGSIRHEVPKMSPIALNDMPNFLNDPEVVLDLTNPLLFLNIKSDIPADVKTSLSFKSDTDPSGTHSTDNLTIKGAAGGYTNAYYLSDKREETYLPTEHKNAEWARVPDFPNLLKRIPKQIEVQLSPVVVACENLDITRDYNVDVDYEFYAPLQFNEGFKLVYQDSETGFDLGSDFEKIDAPNIKVSAKVSSNVPMDLTFGIKPIDRYGREIKAIKPVNVHIGRNADKQEITILLEPTDGYTIHDVLAGTNGVSKLDGVTYRAVIDNPVEGKPLPGNASIRLSDIRISVNGTVSYDAN